VGKNKKKKKRGNESQRGSAGGKGEEKVKIGAFKFAGDKKGMQRSRLHGSEAVLWGPARSRRLTEPKK